MDLFAYRIPANDCIYKGMKEGAFDTRRSVPTWFSYNRRTAQRYAERHASGSLHTLRVGRELKLINIMSGLFHDWLTDRVLDIHRDQEYSSTYQEVMDYLIPLGIINLKDQVDYIRERYGFSASTQEHMKHYGKLLQYKNRFSLHSLDEQLTRLLMRLSVQHGFDGYIAPNRWPSTYHGLFDDELCLYNVSQLFELQKLNYVSATHTQHGGSGRTAEVKEESRGCFVSDPTVSIQERWNTAHIKVLRTFGYTGPIHYDSRGYVIDMTDEEIREWKRSQEA